MLAHGRHYRGGHTLPTLSDHPADKHRPGDDGLPWYTMPMHWLYQSGVVVFSFWAFQTYRFLGPWRTGYKLTVFPGSRDADKYAEIW